MTTSLERVVATYERANRIFTGLPVRCEVEESSVLDSYFGELLERKEGPPAWSIGSDIYFKSDAVAEAEGSREADVALAGLNFHELGHVLYTPMKDSWLRGHLDDWKGLSPAFNVLEDQRIETLLAAQYPALARYFVQAFQSFVVENTDTVYTSHLLAHGRQFLPARLRGVLSAEFVGTWEERSEAEAIIDEYRTLVLGPEQSDDAERALQLISHFSRLIQNLGEAVPTRAHGAGFGGATTTLMQVDAQRARELIEQGHTVVELVGSQSGGQRRRRRPAYRATARRSGPAPRIEPNRSITAVSVPPVYVESSRRFRQELDRLRGDADPGWVRHQSSGRLNSQRAAFGADPDSAFDRWQESSFDASDIEAVLLLDASGSMHTAMREVCAAAWAIKRAIHAVGGRTTIYSYDDVAGLVYAAGDRADAATMRAIEARGENEPLTVLEAARGLLAGSRAANRMLITLADGDWGSEEDAAHAVVDELRATGVMTAIGLLGQYVSDDPHHHEHAVRLSSPAALVTMARHLVRGSRATPRLLRC
ncbi:vWA domain-containing protein [Dermacoccus abyssi]|uniref:vWA domain-containing protein n=1 Tax=Dermacoccus abyssi TaxID=322596 RepID=UPI002AD2A254|nr:vWA domain-containing protein [Dermacoccus abyssi]